MSPEKDSRGGGIAPVRILGIETSCDETAAAVVEDGARIRSSVIASQYATHGKYEGVVPELASREHVRNIVPVVRQAVEQAGVAYADVDAIAVTVGPGLAGALLVGLTYAKSLALALEKPLLAVNHLEGHIHAVLLEERLEGRPEPEFPALSLVVSGGHTLLALTELKPGPANNGNRAPVFSNRILGRTRDDAAGEAFDKVAKLLGQPYPGGPALAQLAERGKPGRFKFSRPMTDKPGLDFSFSGLKTAVLTALPRAASEQDKADLARGFEDCVADTLVIKCERALEHTGFTRLVVAGGVGANLRLRAALQKSAARSGTQLFFPRREFCTDNAAMIAYAGWARLADGRPAAGPIEVRARWPLSELRAPL